MPDSTWYAHLNEAQLNEVRAHLQRVELEPHEIIIDEGEDDQTAILIESGEVRIERDGVTYDHSGPGELIAWMGPAISQPAFEVGAEVREAFLELDARAETCFEPNDQGRWQADLYGLARQQLSAAGVTAVHGGEWCTYADAERFFSYRRDGQCGRMATFVARKR